MLNFQKNSLTERIAKRSRYLGIEIDKELKIDIDCKKLLKRASKVASKIYHTLASFQQQFIKHTLNQLINMQY